MLVAKHTGDTGAVRIVFIACTSPVKSRWQTVYVSVCVAVDLWRQRVPLGYESPVHRDTHPAMPAGVVTVDILTLTPTLSLPLSVHRDT